MSNIGTDTSCVGAGYFWEMFFPPLYSACQNSASLLDLTVFAGYHYNIKNKRRSGTAMGTVLKRIPRIPPVFTGVFAFMWLVNLQHTDSYFGVYILIAVCGLYASVHQTPERPHHFPCALAAALFSGAIVLANYNLFSPWSALLNLCNAGCSLLGGWLVFYSIFAFALEKLPLAPESKGRTYPQVVFLGRLSTLTSSQHSTSPTR